jgi:hypothetical protein
MNRTTLFISSLVLMITPLALAQAPATPGQQPSVEPAPTAPDPSAQPGASAQAGAPAPAPASRPTTRRIAVIPQGFTRAQIGGRVAVFEPADEAWITAALQKLAPATRPATLPASILEKLTAQREPIIRQIMADLALTDPVPVARQYDLEIVEKVRPLEGLRPPILFLITHKDRLAEVMRAGWDDPHYYYNRAADSVTFNPAGILNTEGPMDDTVVPAVYDPKDPPEKRGDSVTAMINSVEASIAAAIDTRARMIVGVNFARIVEDNAIKPLNLKDDQGWFGLGLSSYLSAKYASNVIGVSQKDLITSMTFEHPQNPLKASAIDLLHPTDLKTVRPDAAPLYLDAVRRKSTRAIADWLGKAGDGAIPKMLTAVKDKKPVDGVALANLIKQQTGFDITPLLGRCQSPGGSLAHCYRPPGHYCIRNCSTVSSRAAFAAAWITGSGSFSSCFSFTSAARWFTGRPFSPAEYRSRPSARIASTRHIRSGDRSTMTNRSPACSATTRGSMLRTARSIGLMRSLTYRMRAASNARSCRARSPWPDCSANLASAGAVRPISDRPTSHSAQQTRSRYSLAPRANAAA